MYISSILVAGLTAGIVQASAVNKRAAVDDCLKEAGVPTLVSGTPDHQRDVSPFNVRVPFTPAVVAVPVTIPQIQAAVVCGAKVGVKVTPKSGGHSYGSLGLGGEDGHLIIQLDRMFRVTLNTETNVATIQPGARLGHIVTELYRQGGRAFAHGTCPGVGVSGHVLHGGFGFSSHLHGLALDWIKSLQVVLADGSLVTASLTENADLFWALRGAGSNFGIVASYEFNTYEAPKLVTRFQILLQSWNKENIQANLEAVEDYLTNTMPPELNFRVSDYGGGPQIEALYYGDGVAAVEAVAPLLKSVNGTLDTGDKFSTEDWLRAQTVYAYQNDAPIDVTGPYSEHDNFYSKSLALKSLSGASAKGFGDFLFDQKIIQPSTKERGYWFQLDMHGGKHSAITTGDHSSSSYAHRDKKYLIQFYDRVEVNDTYPAGGTSFLNRWVNAVTAPLPKDDWGMYINYVDTELDRETANRLYYGASLPRLRELKAKFDPKELFYSPLSIRPAAPT